MVVGGGLWVALSVGCGERERSGSHAAPEPNIEFRSGGSSTEIAVDDIDDEHACFLLSYACDEPEAVELHIDNELAMQWHRSHELHEGEALALAPGSYCHQTHELSSGQHTFALTEVCDGIPSTDSVNASTAPPDFRIATLTANQPSYTKGDTVILHLEAGAANLGVSADLSAVDSTYSTGNEQVTALGGGAYEIEYTISSSNLWRVGDKTVPVVVSDGSTTKQRLLRLRYLPRGFPRASLAHGSYHLASLPSRTTAQNTQLLDVTIGSRPSASPDDPTLFDEVPETVGAFRPLVVEFSTPQQVGATILVEMRDPNRDGHFVAPFEITDESCPPTGGPCTYEATGVLTEEPHTVAVGDPIGDIQLRVVFGTGQASPLSQSEPVIGCGCSSGVTIVEGTVKYEFEECLANPAAEIDTSPQYHPATCTIINRPARRIMVELLAIGTTGQVLLREQAFASENGGFFLQVPDTAAELNHVLKVWSVSPKAPGLRVGVGAWQGGYIPEASALTDDPGDYEVYSWELKWFRPNGDATPTSYGYLMSLPNLEIKLPSCQTQGCQTQRNMAWATHMIDESLRGIDYFGTWVDKHDMHWLNIAYQHYDIGLDNFNGTGETDRYNQLVGSVHPGLILVLPESTDSWTIAHELAHYFHGEYMRSDGNYGSFKEPMAQTNAGMIRATYAPATFLGDTWWGAWFPATTSYNQNRESLDFNAHTKAQGSNVVIEESNLQFFEDHSSYIDCASRPSCPCEPEDTEASNPAVAKSLCVLGTYGYVWRMFWDLNDGTGSEQWSPQGVTVDFDNVNGQGGSQDPKNHKLMDVLFGYLGGKKHPQNSNYSDHGIEKADPVDILDGMMCRGHMTEQQADTLLHDVMNFVYDFTPNNPSCL